MSFPFRGFVLYVSRICREKMKDIQGPGGVRIGRGPHLIVAEKETLQTLVSAGWRIPKQGESPPHIRIHTINPTLATAPNVDLSFSRPLAVCC